MLTQAEADALMAMKKKLLLPQHPPFVFPANGQKRILEGESLDHRERFLFDINRASLKVSQCTYQNRSRGNILLRLYIEGPTHENPDDDRTEVPCPHLHIFREGWGTKWAYPCPPELLSGGDLDQILIAFLQYCHVINVPSIQGG